MTTNDLYIRFMAPVTQHSAERLLAIIDAAFRTGTQKIHLLLSSPGGSVMHGIALHNFLKGIPIEIITYNFGTVDSIGVIIYCAGSKRLSVPHARFLLHPVSAQFQGVLDEHRLNEAQNGLKIDQQNIARVIAAVVNKEENEILNNIHSRKTLDPEQAKDFGLVSEINPCLIPAGGRLEVVRESEASMPQQIIGQPIAFPPVQFSPPPPGSESNVYSRGVSFTKAF